MVEDVVIEFRGDFDEVKEELEDEEFTKEVQMQPTGQAGAAGGGGGGDGAGGILTEAFLGGEIGADVGNPATGITGALGGLSSAMMALLGVLTVAVGFLALLEPVQQALGFIMRQFELMIIPLVVALMPLMEALRDFAVQVLKFFQNPRQFVSNMVNGLMRALAPVVNAVIAGLNMLPGVDIAPVTVPGGGASGATGFRGTGDRVTQGRGGQGPTGASVGVEGFAQSVAPGVGMWLTEASDSEVVERTGKWLSQQLGGDFFQ